MEEADEYCPHCDNQFVSRGVYTVADSQVIEAKEPKAMLGVEGEDARVDNRMLKDDRAKERSGRSLLHAEDNADKLDVRG